MKKRRSRPTESPELKAFLKRAKEWAREERLRKHGAQIQHVMFGRYNVTPPGGTESGVVFSWVWPPFKPGVKLWMYWGLTVVRLQ